MTHHDLAHTTPIPRPHVACTTLRWRHERKLLDRITRRHEAPMWPVCGAIAIVAGLLGAGLVLMLAEMVGR